MRLTAEALHDLAQLIAKVPREARIEHANGTVLAAWTVNAGDILDWHRAATSMFGPPLNTAHLASGPLGCRVRPGPGFGIRYDSNHPWITVASFPRGFPGQLISWRPSIDDAARQLHAYADFARDQIEIPPGGLIAGQPYQFSASGVFSSEPVAATLRLMSAAEIRASEGLPPLAEDGTEPAWCRRCGGTGSGCWCPQPAWSDDPRFDRHGYAVEDLPDLDDLPAY